MASLHSGTGARSKASSGRTGMCVLGQARSRMRSACGIRGRPFFSSIFFGRAKKMDPWCGGGTPYLFRLHPYRANRIDALRSRVSDTPSPAKWERARCAAPSGRTWMSPWTFRRSRIAQPERGEGDGALFRLHPYRAVQPDGLAIEHHALADLLHELRVFLRLAETRREGHLRAE